MRRGEDRQDCLCVTEQQTPDGSAADISKYVKYQINIWRVSIENEKQTYCIAKRLRIEASVVVLQRHSGVKAVVPKEQNMRSIAVMFLVLLHFGPDPYLVRGLIDNERGRTVLHYSEEE